MNAQIVEAVELEVEAGESPSKGQNERVQKLPGFTRPRLDDNGPVLQGELCF